MTQILVMLEKECRVEKWNRGKSGSQRKGCSMKKSFTIVWDKYRMKIIITVAVLLVITTVVISLCFIPDGKDAAFENAPKLSSSPPGFETATSTVDQTQSVPQSRTSTPVFVPSRETLPQSSTAAPAEAVPELPKLPPAPPPMVLEPPPLSERAGEEPARVETDSVSPPPQILPPPSIEPVTGSSRERDEPESRSVQPAVETEDAPRPSDGKLRIHPLLACVSGDTSVISTEGLPVEKRGQKVIVTVKGGGKSPLPIVVQQSGGKEPQDVRVNIDLTAMDEPPPVVITNTVVTNEVTITNIVVLTNAVPAIPPPPPSVCSTQTVSKTMLHGVPVYIVEELWTDPADYVYDQGVYTKTVEHPEPGTVRYPGGVHPDDEVGKWSPVNPFGYTVGKQGLIPPPDNLYMGETAHEYKQLQREVAIAVHKNIVRRLEQRHGHGSDPRYPNRTYYRRQTHNVHWRR